MARLGSGTWSLSCLLAGFSASHPCILRASLCPRGSFVWSLLTAWLLRHGDGEGRACKGKRKPPGLLRPGLGSPRHPSCLVLSVKANRRPTQVQEKGSTHIPRPAHDLRTPAFSLGIHFLPPALVAPQSQRSFTPSTRASGAPSSMRDTLLGSE